MVAQKITIEPVTRIEGHAKVTVHLKEDGSVEHAYFHVNEFRGFEKFCEGRVSAAFAPSATIWLPPRLAMLCSAALLPDLPVCCVNSCTWVRSSRATVCTSLSLPDLTCCVGLTPIPPSATLSV